MLVCTTQISKTSNLAIYYNRKNKINTFDSALKNRIKITFSKKHMI